jgi:hypothetical protein
VPDTGCESSSSADDCTPDTPKTPEVPVEHPKTPETPIVDVPGSGGELPFTGPGDVLLAIVLALLAGTGGFLLLAGAAGREQIEALSARNMGSPSGFKLAYRELLKQQVD